MSETNLPKPPAAQSQESAMHADMIAAHQAVLEAYPRPRPRLWPGVLVVAAMWLAMWIPRWVAPGTFAQFMIMFYSPIVATLCILIWWTFFSRIRWADRGLGILAFVAITAGSYPLMHPSYGFFGMLLFAAPLALTGWVFWGVVSGFLDWQTRRIGLIAIFVLVYAYCATLRFEGVDGSMSAALAYRWQPTAEQTYLAEIAAGKLREGKGPDAPIVTPITIQDSDWPSFRGSHRDGSRPGVRIPTNTNWKEQPPRLVWRHRIGPGWSSFAVIGKRIYTQEQRGDNEVVVCYDADMGAEIWAHDDPTRFTETVSGAGPRATPTYQDGKIYALGAMGHLNCLDASSGKLIWTRDIKTDSEAATPIWGFSASPLIAQGIVTVFAGGPNNKSVLGYNATDGSLAWAAGEGKLSYCSLQLTKIGGEEQVLIATDAGMTAFQPKQGTILWHHAWQTEEGLARIVQPALIGESDLLLGTGMTVGTRRIHLDREGPSWTTKELWTTKAIKPYYNDLVIHKGYLYGFDGPFFTCVNLADGKANWRARGYGNGQVLLLPDQDLLLILSEKGEVALVEANSAAHKELTKFQAIEGKTWNHPVVAHGKLFIRNGEQAACYQLVEKDDSVKSDK